MTIKTATTSPTYPGLRSPRFWQKLNYILSPAQYLDTLAQVAPDIADAPVIGTAPTVLLVSHPEGLKQIFNNDAKQFVAPRNRLLQPVVGDRSIFSLEGQRHRRERKLLMPPFHGDRMRAYGDVICQLTRQQLTQQPIGQVFVMREIAQSIALDVILQTVFGLDDSDRSRHIAAKIVELTGCFQSKLFLAALFLPALQRDFGLIRPWTRFTQIRTQIKTLLLDEIRARRANPDPSRSDILSLMLAARDEEDHAMDEEELHDELITLLIAGHETTANSVAWAMYWIAQHANVRDRLVAELRHTDERTDPAELARLPYLNAVCNEAMRLYPSVMMTVPRRTTETTEILGHRVPADTNIYGCIYIAHRNPAIYPDPLRFNPDRFLDQQYSPYEFLPFGGGVRRCLGEALALFELRLVIATIWREFSVEYAETQPERPTRRGVSLTPERGVRLRRLA
jgi:cytochrome P450